MKYCSECAAPLVLKVPEGDSIPRYICEQCHTIHYQNPKIVTGCLAVWEDRVLMCKRAIEPRYGLWTLPAGFMENGETTEQAAARETLEEACAHVEQMTLYALYSLPHINQVYIIFLCRMVTPQFAAGVETLETSLFSESEIPWDTLAFSVVRHILNGYFTDRQNGLFPVKVATIEPYQQQ